MVYRPLVTAERQRISGSDSGADTAAAQASALLLWSTGAELAVAGVGDDAGWPEADGGEQGTPAKAGARSCLRHAAGTGSALYVGAVAGAHLRSVCAPVQQPRNFDRQRGSGAAGQEAAGAKLTEGHGKRKSCSSHGGARHERVVDA